MKDPNSIRADVIGSLLRPAWLLDARERLERGELAPPAFKTIEDRAVDEAVALQEAAGLDVVTDGEMRRYAFYGHLVEALEGFDRYAGWSITFRDADGHEAALKRPVVVEKLKWRRQMSVEEYTYLRGRTSRPVKVTLVSAQQAAAYYDPDKSRGAYALDFLEDYLRVGMPAGEILRMMTTNSARLLGVEKERGAIKENLFADIIATPENPLDNIQTLKKFCS